MAERSSEGLLSGAMPLRLAKIWRLVGEVRIAEGALLLDADPTRAGAINTVPPAARFIADSSIIHRGVVYEP